MINNIWYIIIALILIILLLPKSKESFENRSSFSSTFRNVPKIVPYLIL